MNALLSRAWSEKGAKMNKKTLARLLATALFFGLITPCSLTPSHESSEAKKAITLKKKTLYLEPGETGKIVVKNAPKAAKITYRSSDKTVATVSKKGVVKAKYEGKAKIKIVVKKKKKTIKKLTCKVYVESPVPINPTTPTPDTRPTPSVDPKFTGDKNAEIGEDFTSQAIDFSVELVKAGGEKDIAAGENVLISPQSVLTDMMMAANGAATTTKTELEKVLTGTVGFEKFRKALSDYNAKLIYSDKVLFRLANSIWIREDPSRIQVKEDFLEAGRIWFNAESQVLPFDETMVDKVNEWVDKNTFGMIPVLLKDVPPETDVMHLINALAFEGAWAEQYKDVQLAKDQDFTDSKGNKQKSTMLCETTGSYLHDEKAEGFVKPYEGYDYAFVAILPDEKVGVTDYLKSLDGKAFKRFLESGERGYAVHTQIPEFSYDYSTPLNDALKAMGIRESFTSAADFSEMADTKSGELFIGQVTHKTHIELDKNGTKAAAVTDIAMADGTSIEPDPIKEKYIYLNRPFIYAIVQQDTGIPVFMGVVNTLL